jgi:hypothetical protein
MIPKDLLRSHSNKKRAWRAEALQALEIELVFLLRTGT